LAAGIAVAFYCRAVRGEDLLGDDPGRCFVQTQTPISIHDPEIEMNRIALPRLRMRRLVAALRRLAPGMYAMEKPRRSVDREFEEFSSPWE